MARFFIDRPVFAIVTSLLLLLIGIIAGLNLPIAQYPQITLPTIRVSAAYPGANAQVVEESLAQPIEQQVNGVDGMLYMESTMSGSGQYSLNVTFGLEVDPDIASVQVQNRVAQANSRLPAEVLNAGITTQKSTPDTLMYVALHSPGGTYDELFLANYASINLVDTLKRVKGVGNVQVFGSDYGMRIWLRPDRMSRLGVTPSDVANAVRAQNVQAPAGQVGQFPSPPGQQFQYGVEVQGRLTTAEEFARIIVRAAPDGSFIRIGDIARVELGNQEYNFAARFNGRPASVFAVSLTPEASAIETADLIKTELVEIARQFPEDVEYTVINDNTKFIKASLESVVHTFFEALLLVLVVVFLFLQNWRATLIPMLAVPISLVGTFAVFTLLGFSINTLTLFAMVLAIGIVVDDAIVVVEAVEHHIEEGLSPRDATVRAIEEVSGPVVAIALVLAAVFVPVAFLGGIAGQLYRQFAITVAVSTLISAFVALSLTPALCALLLKPRGEPGRGLLGRFFTGFNRRFEQMQAGYVRGVRTGIRRMLLSLGLLVLFIVGAVGLMNIVPGAYVPAEDQGAFIGSIELPEAAALQRTIDASARVEQFLRETPGVEATLVVNGFSILASSPKPNSALFVTTLVPWEERTDEALGVEALIAGVFRQAAAIPEAMVLAFNPPALPGLGATGGFSFKIQDRSGGTPMELALVADEFVAAASQRPEIGTVYSKFNPRTPAYQLEVDREKALKLGVPVPDIFAALQTFLGGLQVNDFSRFGRTYKVTMQAEPEFRGEVDAIALFEVRSASGEMVPLSTLLQPESISSPATLQRYNLFRTADIGGDAAPGYSSGEAIAALEAVAATLPQGYGYEWSGISRQEKESAGQAPIVMGLAVLFVFLFLAALYESWAVPFAVLLAVPLGVFGAMLGLQLTGLTNNIYAQVGLILLIGLAAKNAILIVEFAKVRRDRGMDAVEAAVEAARLRLRPILMTSFAFILGVVPLAIATGAGAASRRSMGVPVVTGMLAATVLAVFLVPVLFVAVEALIARVRRKPAGQRSDSDAGSAP